MKKRKLIYNFHLEGEQKEVFVLGLDPVTPRFDTIAAIQNLLLNLPI